jgi:hypothetical protein
MTEHSKIDKEDCGCEFISYWDDKTGDSCCYLHKCRCRKHYDEQFWGEWYDHEGHHKEFIQNKTNALPLLISKELFDEKVATAETDDERSEVLQTYAVDDALTQKQLELQSKTERKAELDELNAQGHPDEATQ